VFQSILTKNNSPDSIKKHLERYYNTIFPFYLEHGVSHNLIINFNQVSCRFFINPKAHKKILIVNGYKESYLKYAEVIFDLYHKGYSVYTYDHRGQGFSEKFKNQNGRGYLDSFDEMVQDFVSVFQFVEQHDQNQEVFVIAHSMGGAISTLAVCTQKMSLKRLILSAPMFGINMGPASFLEYPAYILCLFFSKIGFGNKFAFGQKPCFPLVDFKDNDLTHSKARYQVWQSHIRDTPEVQLGGPTFKWIEESLKAARLVRKQKNNNKTQILLLQAENETVVRNDTHDTFVKHNQCTKKIIIPFAKHEILLEIDFLREQVFEHIFKFLS